MKIKQKCIEWIKQQMEIYRNNGRKQSYVSYYKKIIQRHPELGHPAEGEESWLAYWREYDRDLSPLAYRVFSRYIGPDIHILPLEICVNVIEPVLTPPQYRGFYRNKNSLNLLMPEGTTSKSIIRKMVGFYYNHEYQPINMNEVTLLELLTPYEKVLFKPAMEDSGRGIQLFQRKGSYLVNSLGEKLTVSYLNQFPYDDFQIQEYIEQSDFTADFNATSVNSFRIMTYRSVSNGELHVPNILFKVGGKGNYVDNIHGGGVICGVDKNGKLMNYAVNTLGDRFDYSGKNNLKENEYYVPKYDRLLTFAKEVANRIPHHHLLALDIALNRNDDPVLIEVNSEAFSGWLFQFTIGSVFGDFTDEVINYCYKKIKH